MIEGVETGYEPKFDFPERSGPPGRVYTLATVPRTGSTFVSHLLWQTGCLGAPLEYLNFLPGSPYAFAHGVPAKQRDLWHGLQRRRASPNGVFGLKCFSAQLRELQQHNPQLLIEYIGAFLTPGAPVLRLRRRDRIAHAISYARAALSGIWHKVQEGEGAAQVAYSDEAVQHAHHLLDQQDADWDMLLRERQVRQLPLWYEDVVADPAAAVQAVAEFLGVILDPTAAVSVPSIERQSQDDASRWAERYGAGVKPD